MDYKARFKYNDIEWLVIDAFKYEGEKYMYLVEDIKDKIETEEELKNYKKPIRMIYVKHVGDNNYLEITDRALIDQLNIVVATNVLNGNK